MIKASVIIQARMGATRLPNKVLLPLAGKPVLTHVVSRAMSATRVDRVVVATTTAPADEAVVKAAEAIGVGVFRGSEADVLDRYYQAATHFGFEHVVRITADCPLMDPAIIDRVIGLYDASRADYAANILEETFPDGEDVEVFSMAALKRAWAEATLKSQREHVTLYIRNTDGFVRRNLAHEVNLAHHRWTLDEPKDYDKLNAIMNALYPVNPYFGMNEVLAFLHAHPEIDGVNSNIRRNEGLIKSLSQDGEVC